MLARTKTWGEPCKGASVDGLREERKVVAFEKETVIPAKGKNSTGEGLLGRGATGASENTL